MGWFYSILIALITAAVGCFGAGLVATKCVRWYRISSFEGGSGYYVVGIGLLGIVAGLIVGLICARIVAAGINPGFPKGLGLALSSMTGLVFTAGFLAWFAADHPPEIDGQSLELAVEVRGPKGQTMPMPVNGERTYASVYVPNGRSQMGSELQLHEVEEIEGRWVVSALVPLQTTAAAKFLHVYFNAENAPLFPLPLRRHPTKKDLGWSPWVDSSWAAGTPEPAPDQKFGMRFQLRVVVPPPPGPTKAEIDAQHAAEELARFEALSSAAPLTEWLPYTKYGAREDWRGIAISKMTARATFGAEIAGLMLADDAETAADALRLVEHLPQPGSSLTAAVSTTGRQIVEVIRTVNATTVEADPSYLKAADASIRFSAWMCAVRVLREKAGGDFTAELREILELSRVRDDSHVMRQDIRRVASYYVQQWTGLAPLAGDPPPR